MMPAEQGRRHELRRWGWLACNCIAVAVFSRLTNFGRSSTTRSRQRRAAAVQSVRDAVDEKALRERLRRELRPDVLDDLRDELEEEVWQVLRVELRGETKEALRAELEDKIRRQLRTELGVSRQFADFESLAQRRTGGTPALVHAAGDGPGLRAREAAGDQLFLGDNLEDEDMEEDLEEEEDLGTITLARGAAIGGMELAKEVRNELRAELEEYVWVELAEELAEEVRQDLREELEPELAWELRDKLQEEVRRELQK